MKMIVGLGNPGKKYENTKHNVGFMTVDRLAKTYNTSFKKSSFEAQVADFFVNGEKILLVKPQTYMNDSGRAVGPLMTYFGIEIEELVVICDDLDLAFGKVRLRQKGSAGGHNGLKSIISHLGTNEFRRLKIGIGHPQAHTSVIHHVLQPFNKQEQAVMTDSINQAEEAIEYFIDNNNFVQTMNRFN
ncbi:aminoacyl-tRNA hydrolase [Tetragenococcus osmophilus]|uniref:Peptidyl-tRNA hydrolase n=1 Tax=Tetragenococcus osmophilus TaxID=526944 RepID=A0AA37XLQ0_9ENTE|nr:aminoacyl-tRNA hydrolase [Tetragenococcus osmophilus]AYW47773.1 aminoacyl-tRNA hydrolase [Tetragenococcus osmophilus]GMA53446.1 peptidyl-tRNA hydrolase [Alicyclobacillus contaminans]GMA72606.1 peptidyl-tRNA hydrolase [Tetragenococcus osmophilus]